MAALAAEYRALPAHEKREFVELGALATIAHRAGVEHSFGETAQAARRVLVQALRDLAKKSRVQTRGGARGRRGYCQGRLPKTSFL